MGTDIDPSKNVTNTMSELQHRLASLRWHCQKAYFNFNLFVRILWYHHIIYQTVSMVNNYYLHWYVNLSHSHYNLLCNELQILTA